MTSQKQLLFAYGLAVHLLIVGIVCYAVLSANSSTSTEPIRLMYKTAAGKVLFDHDIHSNSYGYGISCKDCHHHPNDDENIMSCGVCHLNQTEDISSVKNCLDCHEDEEINDIDILSRVDALHSNCIECHDDAEAGPQDCSQCHVL